MLFQELLNSVGVIVVYSVLTQTVRSGQRNLRRPAHPEPSQRYRRRSGRGEYLEKNNTFKHYFHDASHYSQLFHKTRTAHIQSRSHGAISCSYSSDRRSFEVACTAALLSSEKSIMFNQTVIFSVTIVIARCRRKKKCYAERRSGFNDSYRVHVRHAVEGGSSLGSAPHYHMRYRSATICHRILYFII